MAELVGVDQVLPLALCVPLFLKEQGCEVKENIAKQDNESAILLAKNGKTSSGKRMRAINVRCFHITDQIKRLFFRSSDVEEGPPWIGMCGCCCYCWEPIKL